MGKTITGERFRPSDWAERLYYTVASYGKNGSVIFNPLVNLKPVSYTHLTLPTTPYV